jgi:hypothetical protein
MEVTVRRHSSREGARDSERARIEGVKSFAATGASDESIERRVDKQEGRAKDGDSESNSGRQ